MVTTKGNTSAVEVFGVTPGGAPAKSPTITSLPEAVPFAVDFDSAGHLLIAEAGPNAVASFTIGANGALTQIASAPTGGQATCWIARVGSTFYLSNAASGTVSTFGVKGAALTPLGDTAAAKGTVDAAAVGKFLYVEGGAEGVVEEYAVGAGGKLEAIGSVTVPGAVGGEGIVAS